MKKALVLGGNGFIGHHMARRLKSEGYFVCTVDIKEYEYGEVDFSDYQIIGDLRNELLVQKILEEGYDEIYQYAADMGGAGYIFTGENDANIMSSSAAININVLKHMKGHEKIFYASSACIYPQEKQTTTDVELRESDAYPANPDSAYGFEKLFSENLYDSFARNGGYDIRVGRFHNIFGEEGAWSNGKEKAPAAICRKVAEAKDSIDIWGDGEQTRSFLYIDECIEATRRLMWSNFRQPINIGSDEIISINQLAGMVIRMSDKTISVNHVDGALGVRGRCSNNDLIYAVLGWKPTQPLYDGIKKLYSWVSKQVNGNI